MGIDKKRLSSQTPSQKNTKASEPNTNANPTCNKKNHKSCQNGNKKIKWALQPDSDMKQM